MTDLEKLLREVEFTLQNVSNKPFTKEAFDKFKNAGMNIVTSQTPIYELI